jgi:hypothetical protein
MSDPEADLKRHTANRLAEVGADAAKNAAARKMRSELKERLPRFLWPLIPGVGGSVEDNLTKMAGRKASSMLWSIGCTIAFFGLFALAVVGFGLIVLYAFWSSGKL